jgi:hypothetical protein
MRAEPDAGRPAHRAARDTQPRCRHPLKDRCSRGPVIRRCEKTLCREQDSRQIRDLNQADATTRGRPTKADHSNAKRMTDRPQHRGGALRPVMPCPRTQTVHSWTQNDHIHVLTSNRIDCSLVDRSINVANEPRAFQFRETANCRTYAVTDGNLSATRAMRRNITPRDGSTSADYVSRRPKNR